MQQKMGHVPTNFVAVNDEGTTVTIWFKASRNREVPDAL